MKFTYKIDADAKRKIKRFATMKKVLENMYKAV